jgi:hypothetical protein
MSQTPGSRAGENRDHLWQEHAGKEKEHRHLITSHIICGLNVLKENPHSVKYNGSLDQTTESEILLDNDIWKTLVGNDE